MQPREALERRCDPRVDHFRGEFRPSKLTASLSMQLQPWSDDLVDVANQNEGASL